MYDLLDRTPCELRGESRVLLMSLRVWVRAIKEQECPLRALEPLLAAANAYGALWPLHNYFYWTAAHATRKLHVGCCARGGVTEDEALLISAAQLDRTEAAAESALASFVMPEALGAATGMAGRVQVELARAFGHVQ